jgi:hypothetical protein
VRELRDAEGILTHRAIAKRLGLSKTRVQQLERSALKKLRKAIERRFDGLPMELVSRFHIAVEIRRAGGWR